MDVNDAALYRVRGGVAQPTQGVAASRGADMHVNGAIKQYS